eukprot:scaffold43730_cov153-Amphora_coffeaeformis.AAC.1
MMMMILRLDLPVVCMVFEAASASLGEKFGEKFRTTWDGVQNFINILVSLGYCSRDIRHRKLLCKYPHITIPYLELVRYILQLLFRHRKCPFIQSYAGHWTSTKTDNPKSVKSPAGYIISLGNAPVLWKLKHIQETVCQLRN